MKLANCLMFSCLFAAYAQSEVKVVYDENPNDPTNVQNVKEIKNAYENQISELEIRHKQEASEIRTSSLMELEAEKERNKTALEAKEAEIAKKKADLENLQRKVAEREQKDKQVAQINRDYKLSADLTKKVIRHIGPMPSVLPASSSEGIDAPLNAAFNSFIPMEWKVYVHQNISDQQRISWHADNENWVATLYKLGVRYGYTFDINWNERWVMVNRSDLRFGSTEPANPKVQVMGSDAPPGTEGYMVIDGKIMKVRRSN